MILLSCVTLSACDKTLPPPKLAEQPKPLAVDPRLCADLVPAPKIEGSIVAPVTPEERELYRMFLTSLARLVDHDAAGWERAKVAKAACGK